MNVSLTLTREQFASARRAQEGALEQAVVLGIAGALPVDRAVAVLLLLIRFVRVWRGACEARALAVRFCDGPPVIEEAPGCEKELCEASKVQIYYARLLLNESPDAPACIAILGALYDYPRRSSWRPSIRARRVGTHATTYASYASYGRPCALFGEVRNEGVHQSRARLPVLA